MASIQISELRPAGAQLFQDSESFLNELNDQEMTAAYGGLISISNVSIGDDSFVSISVSQITQSQISVNSRNVVTISAQ